MTNTVSNKKVKAGSPAPAEINPTPGQSIMIYTDWKNRTIKEGPARLVKKKVIEDLDSARYVETWTVVFPALSGLRARRCDRKILVQKAAGICPKPANTFEGFIAYKKPESRVHRPLTRKQQIAKILIDRDGIPEATAWELIEDAQLEFDTRLATGDPDGAEEVCLEYLGLEPDFLDAFAG